MHIEGFVLIGGRSNRLGRDKAFVRLGETTLATRALRTIRESGIASNITFVAGNSTQFAIEAISLDAPFIFDLIEDRGPLGGLHAALSYARSPWIVVLACDLPFVSPDLLKLLGSLVSDEFGAVAPEQFDGRLQPLCSFYKTETAQSVVDKIINQPRVPPPLCEIVAKLSPRIVKPDEYSHLSGADNLFVNINTADDLEKALESSVDSFE